MSEIQWYIQVGPGKKAGPISFERLQKIARQGKIFPSTKVRSDETGAAWVPAHEIPDLFDEAPPADESELPSENTPDVDLPTEEPTNYEALPEEPTTDTEAEKEEKVPFKAGAIVIDIGKGSASKKSTAPGTAKNEKKKTFTGFVIDTSGKKDKNQDGGASPAEEETGNEEPQVEEAPAPVEPKKSDKSSVAVKINLAASPKQNTEESSTVVVSELDLSTKIKKADKSSAAVKINLGDSKKTEESSEIVEAKKSKKKDKKESVPSPKKEKKPTPKKNGRGLPSLLKTAAIVSFLVGGLGAGGIFAVCFQTPGILFAAVLGSVVLVFGALLGVVSWGLAGLAARLILLEKPEEGRTPEVDPGSDDSQAPI